MNRPAPPDTFARPGDVSFGDVVDAWHRLGVATDQEKALVAEVLGFAYRRRATATAPGIDSRGGPRPVSRKKDRVPEPAGQSPGSQGPAPGALEVPLQLGQRLVTASPNTTPAWLLEAVPLEAEKPAHTLFEPPHDPLFRPSWARAISSAACARETDDGGLDLRAVVELLARGQPVRRWPRQRVTTLRLGVQLLVDIGEGMMPFGPDADELSSRIAEVVGRDNTRLLYFSGCPLRGAGSGGMSDWSPYRPPPAGTPIVVLSDLGLTRGSRSRGGAEPREWIAFADRLRLAECPCTVIAPVPRPRWPVAFAKAFRLVPWDRRTPVSDARRAPVGGPAR